jgi:SAM-dependent methyltransferase
MNIETILQGYEESGEALVRPYEAIDPALLYAPVAEVLPSAPCRILDIGAGTGRDAAWLAAKGHRIVAVEPVRALREAGRALHPDPAIRWLDDRLPDLPRVAALGERFDCLLISGVWQHLDAPARQRAIPVVASLLAPDGRLVMSLRHGPGAANRPCFECAPDEAIASAGAAGLDLALQRAAPSIQPANVRAGVTWTWLVFRR